MEMNREIEKDLLSFYRRELRGASSWGGIFLLGGYLREYLLDEYEKIKGKKADKLTYKYLADLFGVSPSRIRENLLTSIFVKKYFIKIEEERGKYDIRFKEEGYKNLVRLIQVIVEDEHREEGEGTKVSLTKFEKEILLDIITCPSFKKTLFLIAFKPLKERRVNFAEAFFASIYSYLQNLKVFLLISAISSEYFFNVKGKMSLLDIFNLVTRILLFDENTRAMTLDYLQNIIREYNLEEKFKEIKEYLHPKYKKDFDKVNLLDFYVNQAEMIKEFLYDADVIHVLLVKILHKARELYEIYKREGKNIPFADCVDEVISRLEKKIISSTLLSSFVVFITKTISMSSFIAEKLIRKFEEDIKAKYIIEEEMQEVYDRKLLEKKIRKVIEKLLSY